MSPETKELSVVRSGSDGQLRGLFYSDAARDLNSKVLSVSRISILGKGSGFCSTSKFLNEVDLKKGFIEIFSRKSSLEK